MWQAGGSALATAAAGLGQLCRGPPPGDGPMLPHSAHRALPEALLSVIPGTSWSGSLWLAQRPASAPAVAVLGPSCPEGGLSSQPGAMCPPPHPWPLPVAVVGRPLQLGPPAPGCCPGVTPVGTGWPSQWVCVGRGQCPPFRLQTQLGLGPPLRRPSRASLGSGSWAFSPPYTLASFKETFVLW